MRVVRVGCAGAVAARGVGLWRRRVWPCNGGAKAAAVLSGLGDAAMATVQHITHQCPAQVYNLKHVERVGDDLYSDVYITLFDALLGAQLPVPTMRGQQLLEVPPGTQHGAQLRMANAGVPRVQQGAVAYGAHYFRVAVAVPRCGEEGLQGGQEVLEQLRQLLLGQEGWQQRHHGAGSD